MPSPDPVLLLHGQPGTGRDWARVRAAIGARAPTLAVDRPGWNGNGPPSDLEGNARAALEALDAVGAERAVVVGHSFGGAVAAWLAATRPERVRALVLVAPAANRESLLWLDRILGAPGVGPLASVAALVGAGAALAARPVRQRVASSLRLEESYLRSAGRLLIAPSAWRAFLVEQRQLLRELPALEARLGSITAPTLIVIGVADRIVPPSSARRLGEQIPGSRVIELLHANHLLPQQRPDRLAELILSAY